DRLRSACRECGNVFLDDNWETNQSCPTSLTTQARPHVAPAPTGGTASKHQHRRSRQHALAKRASCVLTSCRLQSALCRVAWTISVTLSWNIFFRRPHNRHDQRIARGQRYKRQSRCALERLAP